MRVAALPTGGQHGERQREELFHPRGFYRTKGAERRRQGAGGAVAKTSSAPCAPRSALSRGNHMCGIIGYVGERDVVPVLIGGLKKLEYRGYDSAGIAVVDGNGVEVVRAEGKLSNLESNLGENPLEIAELPLGAHDLD